MGNVSTYDIAEEGQKYGKQEAERMTTGNGGTLS